MCHLRSLLLEDRLDRWSGHQPLYPRVVILVASDIERLILADPRNQAVPRQERQIGVCALVTNEVFLALEAAINDADHTDHFLAVPLNSAWDLLGVEINEPCRLAIVGACEKVI